MFPAPAASKHIWMMDENIGSEVVIMAKAVGSPMTINEVCSFSPNTRMRNKIVPIPTAKHKPTYRLTALEGLGSEGGVSFIDERFFSKYGTCKQSVMRSKGVGINLTYRFLVVSSKIGIACGIEPPRFFP